MSSNPASVVSFTPHDARVLGRALHADGAGFEGRQVVNDRLIAEVERVRSAGGATRQADAARAARPASRPSAKGERRSQRHATRARSASAGRTPKAERASASKAKDASAKPRPSRATKAKAASTPGVNGVPPILERLLSAFNGAIDWLFGLPGLARAGVITLASVGVLFLFFYQPAANLWAAHRDHDQLIAQQQALTEMSDELEERIAELRTEEGIMDEARIRGYAPAGEIAADASELVGEEDDGIIAVLGQAPEETEDSPLTQALDVFFGYQKRA